MWGYDKGAYKALEDKIFECIQKLCPEEGTIIVSTDQGAGQTAFAAAMRARLQNPNIRIHAYQAFPGEQAAWSEDGDFGQADYIRMCENSDFVRDCSQEPSVLGDMDRNDLLRGAARHNRARCMAQKADGVIAVSNFTHPSQIDGVPGEIATLMRESLTCGTVLWALDPTTLIAHRIDESESTSDPEKVTRLPKAE